MFPLDSSSFFTYLSASIGFQNKRNVNYTFKIKIATKFEFYLKS